MSSHALAPLAPLATSTGNVTTNANSSSNVLTPVSLSALSASANARLTATPSPLSAASASVAGSVAMTPAQSLAPPPPVPFHRIDTHEIKQQLHDALGEAGLPYWKALNGYLLGQVGRHELEALVRGWLKGKNLQLHNQLLASLLHNASSPLISNITMSPLTTGNKRRKGGINAPDFDSDPSYIEPRGSVQYWVMGMGGKERERVRRALEPGEADADGEAEAEPEPPRARKRKWSLSTANPDLVPLAQSSRAVPSANQLGSRIAQIAQTCGLDVAPDVQREVGEFMGVGLTTHLADIVQSSKHMLGRDRPGLETVRVPLGIKTNGVNVGTAAPHANGANGTANANGSANGTANGNVDHPVGPSSLHTMQYLFTLHPGLNPQASPTLYKLQSGMTQAEVEKASRPQPVRAAPSKAAASLSMVPTTSASGLPGASQVASALASAPSATAAGATTSPSKAATALHAAAGQGKIDTVASTLVDTGLLKIDKAGHDEQGERKREKKHNLHWKYEDPALIFKDLLG